MSRWILLASALLLLAGCGSNGSVACDLADPSGAPTLHQCNELIGLDGTQRSDAEEACPRLGGTLVDACPLAGQIGVCKLTLDGAVEDLHFYSSVDAAGVTHESTCAMLKGLWTAS
jgi:hypothetical protein